MNIETFKTDQKVLGNITSGLYYPCKLNSQFSGNLKEFSKIPNCANIGKFLFLFFVFLVLLLDWSNSFVVLLLYNNALTFFNRCHAFWEYILQHPWEDYSNATKQNFAHNVLLIIDKLCSCTQRGMLPTVQGIVQEFSKSAFFKLVLPEIVENLAKENCIR